MDRTDFAAHVSETAVEEALLNALVHREDFEELLAAIADDDELHVDSGTTFERDGVLTNNRGVVLTLSDGSEFQITIVRSR